MTETKALTKKEESALATLFDADAGAGFEDATADDFALPFLKLLQKMSPEVDRDDGAYVEGAEPGMYLDTATKELLETVDFIPCLYHRAMVEWRDQDAGGGFVGQHPVGYELDFPRDGGRWRTGEDTHLADTRYFFGLRLRPDGDVTPDVLSFSSTQLKKARSWMTQLQAQKFTGADGKKKTLPIYASIWRLSSVPEENDKGTWRGYKIERVGPVTDEALAAAARGARKMFEASASNVKPPENAPDGEKGPDVPF